MTTNHLWRMICNNILLENRIQTHLGILLSYERLVNFIIFYLIDHLFGWFRHWLILFQFHCCSKINVMDALNVLNVKLTRIDYVFSEKEETILLLNRNSRSTEGVKDAEKVTQTLFHSKTVLTKFNL